MNKAVQQIFAGSDLGFMDNHLLYENHAIYNILVELCWLVNFSSVCEVANQDRLAGTGQQRTTWLHQCDIGTTVAKLCFPKMSSRSNSLEDFAISSKQTNREFVAFKLTTSDSVFSLQVLHLFFQIRYFRFDICPTCSSHH